MRTERSTVVLTTILIAAVIGITMLPRLHRWERDHGFPFGKMCNSFFTGYEDTCRRDQ